MRDSVDASLLTIHKYHLTDALSFFSHQGNAAVNGIDPRLRGTSV